MQLVRRDRGLQPTGDVSVMSIVVFEKGRTTTGNVTFEETGAALLLCPSPSKVRVMVPKQQKALRNIDGVLLLL